MVEDSAGAGVVVLVDSAAVVPGVAGGAAAGSERGRHVRVKRLANRQFVSEFMSES